MNRIAALCLFTFASLSTAEAQDATKGEQVFKQCAACHAVGPAARNKVGPELNGLIGRKAGSVEDYRYSPANKASGVIWSDENFTTYIKDPKGFMPGNKMAFAGLHDENAIKDLIAYLKMFKADGSN